MLLREVSRSSAAWLLIITKPLNLGVSEMQIPWLLLLGLGPKSKYEGPSGWNLAMGTGSLLLGKGD